ncbi:hypothetical protein EHW71_07680 [Clostridium butyricum]|uniref:hypothetical protein n=1 Tax=Clostridium butyricum TaxID=1492 RepID=UPI000F52396D|nr:hypothetical protein [Clostridium butyricum]RQN11087.1 hypothetical protein EHW71_07680 [Clostridium butyricum]
MDTKLQSFMEIINNNVKGEMWCDGIALIRCEGDGISIDNIYNVSINRYPIEINEKKFVSVYKTDYNTAIKEFNNGKQIISCAKYGYTEEKNDYKQIKIGGSVYSHTKSGEVIINDKIRFNNIQDVNISSEEQTCSWLVMKQV